MSSRVGRAAPRGARRLARSLRAESLEVRHLLAVVNVNFQLAGAPIPGGYLPDTGEVFAARGNGESYGWNFDHTDVARDREVNPDQRLDTLVHFKLGGVWELALPNGAYDVTVSVGDAAVASTHTIVAEGLTMINGVALGANQFQQATQTITVSDGRLTLTQGALPDKSTRINYIEVVSSGTTNQPPFAPTITEPTFDGEVVNPADVHMELIDYFDPDGDPHASTDWEIWTDGLGERVWAAINLAGVEKVHTHLGDGAFEGSLTGATQFLYDTDYVLRVRVRDDQGSYGPYALREFHTGMPSETFPLELQDVLGSPTPRWIDSAGVDLVLPASSASVSLESAFSEILLAFRGFDGVTNTLDNPDALPEHALARIVVRSGTLTSTLALPESTIEFVDNGGAAVTIYLPEITLAPGDDAVFWVAADGATYFGDLGQTTPDFSNLARGAAVPWIVRQPGYVVEVVATGFQLPVNIAFVPNPGPEADDPYYYVAELYGSIKVVTRDGQVSDYATGLLNFNPTGDFPGSGEQGLSGLVVDPTNGDLYASLLYSSVPGVEAAPHYPRVIRLASTDGGLTASSITTVLDMVGESQGQSHQISNVSFGPDGMLYVHVGDGFDTATAQNLNSFRGKVLRLNRNGQPPTDNPFYNGAPITARDYVWAYGFRNPFGGVWRQSDDRHFEVENGPSVDRFTEVVAGRNYGWNGSDQSMATFALYNWSPATAPVNVTVTEPEVFDGSGFPAEKMGHLFVSESGATWASGPQGNGKKITEMVVDSAGALVSGPTTLIEYSGSGKATAAALASGPDGLYFSDLYKDLNFASPIDRGSNILRVRFVGSADFAADHTYGDPGLAVTFSDASNVPDPVAWEWDFGDGATSDEQNPVHVYTAVGSYDVSLRVTTAAGRVVVAHQEQFVRIVAPNTPGVLATYYSGTNFGAPLLTRIDGTIDFNWGGAAPDPAVGADGFSVRWLGQVTPQFSQTYTFYTTSDDGVRLWVNNQLVVDNWTDHGSTTDTGTIGLLAGQKYDLRMEYYENGGDAVARLEWSSPSRARQVVPMNRLSVPVAPVQAPRILGVTVHGEGGAYAIPAGSGEQLRSIDLGGALQSVSIAFSRDVSAAQSSLQIFGADTGPLAVTGYGYQAATRTGTWTFTTPAALFADTLTLTLADSVLSTQGLALDGGWTNPASLDDQGGTNYPSGDGQAGGAFVFVWTVLPGDANRDNRVTGADFTLWADHFGAASPEFHEGDFNGDGSVSGADYTIWADFFGVDLTESLSGSLAAARERRRETASAALLAPLAESPRDTHSEARVDALGLRPGVEIRPLARRTRALDAELFDAALEWRASLADE